MRGLSLYLFPIAAVANCHKLRGLKQHTFIILQFCRSNPKVQGLYKSKTRGSLWEKKEVWQQKQRLERCIQDGRRGPWVKECGKLLKAWKDCGGDSVSLPFPAAKCFSVLGLLAPVFHLQIHHFNPCFAVLSPFSHLNPLTSLSHRYLWLHWVYPGKSCIISHPKILNWVLAAKSLLPCKLTYS